MPHCVEAAFIGDESRAEARRLDDSLERWRLAKGGQTVPDRRRRRLDPQVETYSKIIIINGHQIDPFSTNGSKVVDSVAVIKPRLAEINRTLTQTKGQDNTRDRRLLIAEQEVLKGVRRLQSAFLKVWTVCNEDRIITPLLEYSAELRKIYADYKAFWSVNSNKKLSDAEKKELFYLRDKLRDVAYSVLAQREG